MAEQPYPSSPVEAIPPSDVIRERLAQNLREANLLRSLLKLSKRAEEHRGHPPHPEGARKSA